MDQCRGERLLIGYGCGEIAVESQHLPGTVERVRDQATGDQWPDRKEPVLEGRHHAEITAAAADGPEQIRMLLGANLQNPSLRCNQLDRVQIIESQPVFPHKPPDTAAESQPRDTGG